MVMAMAKAIVKAVVMAGSKGCSNDPGKGRRNSSGHGQSEL